VSDDEQPSAQQTPRSIAIAAFTPPSYTRI